MNAFCYILGVLGQWMDKKVSFLFTVHVTAVRLKEAITSEFLLVTNLSLRGLRIENTKGFVGMLPRKGWCWE